MLVVATEVYTWEVAVPGSEPHPPSGPEADLPDGHRQPRGRLTTRGRLPIELIMTTGPAVDPSALRAPANAEVHQFLPHSEVLPDCAAVIGHGGHSTTFQATRPWVARDRSPAASASRSADRRQSCGSIRRRDVVTERASAEFRGPPTAWKACSAEVQASPGRPAIAGRRDHPVHKRQFRGDRFRDRERVEIVFTHRLVDPVEDSRENLPVAE